MDWLQQASAIIGVLLCLGATLFWLQRRGLVSVAAPKRVRSGRRMETIERLVLAPNHSLHLVRVGARALLIAVSPSGCAMLESISEPDLHTGPKEDIR